MTVPAPVQRLVLFGDPHGLPPVLDAAPRGCVVGLVGAAIRPHQHAALAALAASEGLPLLIQPRPSDPSYSDFLGALRALAPDLIVVYSYAMRLRAEVLEIPPHGGVNIHGALLPAYRGASPLQHALFNMEVESGATMHVMTPEFDEGPILAQCRVPVRFDDTWVMVYDRIAEATRAMLKAELPRLLAGQLRPVPQDEGQAGYYKRRYPEDGAIDWNQSVLAIYNLVRALVHPHPGSFYDGPEGRVVLDRYLTLAEVAALKFAEAAGGRRLEGPSLRMRPLPAGGPDVVVAIEARDSGAARGRAVFSRIEQPAGRGVLRLTVHAPVEDPVQAEALTLARRFAAEELGLRRLD